jgi:hypothetical protein
MGMVLVDGATFQCNHKGSVKVSKGDARLTVSGKGAITFGMETGISFAPGSPGLVSPCTKTTPPPANTPSPCASTLPAIAGTATLLSVGGVPVLLDNATGPSTNPNDPAAKWSVAAAGQSLLSTS